MKKVFLAIAVLFSISASAQNYNDSVISLQLTQRAAIYVGFFIKNTQDAQMWQNRTAPATLKNYIANGTKLDSLFTVQLKASLINGMVDILLSKPNEATQADRLSILNNSPSIVGYTALVTQINTLANGNGPYKQVAIFIRDTYLQRVADLAALRAETFSTVIEWSKN